MTLITFLHQWQDWLSRLHGWRRYGTAFFAGIGCTLAMAPYYFLPLLIIGYCILLVLVTPKENIEPESAQKSYILKQVFATGWWFGFGYFLTGLYWMGFAFLVRADQFAWMIPIAIPAFAGFLALFFAMPALLYAFTSRKISTWQGYPLTMLQKAMLFTVSISLFEYLRGHVLTGLPWNLTAQSLAGTPAGSQSVALYGTYGLSFVVILLAILPALTLHRQSSTHKNFTGILFCLIGFILLYAGGAIRLTLSPTRYHSDIILTIVQPNIPQKDKINPDLVKKNFEKLITYSIQSDFLEQQKNQKPLQTITRYMVWPENAVSWIDQQPGALRYIGERLGEETIILTGSIRQNQDTSGQLHYFNTMAILEDVKGERSVTGFYDKHHLVPFGEYLPLKGFLKLAGLSQLAPVEDGFTPGTGPVTLAVGPTSFAPLICYETIFPGAIYPRKQRPDWIVTVTNDAWFGDDAGPKQHLDQARLRSVEYGLPMARSANTGISALIDPYGRRLAHIDLYQPGTINYPLPLSAKKTLYSQIGDWGFFLMLLIANGIVYAQARKKASKKTT